MHLYNWKNSYIFYNHSKISYKSLLTTCFLTVLEATTLEVNEISSSVLDISWGEPNGYLDGYELAYELVKTDAYKFYTNNSYNRANCEIGTNYSVQTANKSQILDDLCPMTFYKLTIKTLRNDFEPAEYSKIFQTSWYFNGDIKFFKM